MYEKCLGDRSTGRIPGNGRAGSGGSPVFCPPVQPQRQRTAAASPDGGIPQGDAPEDQCQPDWCCGSEKVLVLGWQVGDGVGLCTLQKGVEYALYRLDFRPGKQDILILSYGHRGTGKTHLNEVSVIGEDSLGVIRQLPVVGFSPVDVFNSPLQIRQQEAVLFLEQAPHVLVLQADGENGYAASVQ